jgi:phosphoglycolate phosphatase
VGDGAKALVMRALQTHTPPQTLDTLTAEFIEIYSRAPAAHTRPYQGVMETLALLQAKGHPLAVVTNKPEQPTHLILRQLGLDHFFDVVIGGDTTAERKPSTLPLQTALAALQKHHDIAPNAAIMVGDSRNDIIPAKELGLIAISVAFGYGHLCAADQALSDYHITNFANICPIIDNL